MLTTGPCHVVIKLANLQHEEPWVAFGMGWGMEAIDLHWLMGAMRNEKPYTLIATMIRTQ